MEKQGFDLSLMPPVVWNNLCRTFAEEAKKQWEKNDPDDRRRFEEWKKRKAKASEKKNDE